MTLFQELSEFKESQGTVDEKVLSQLIRDTKGVSMLQLPVSVIRYENEEHVDPTTGAIVYTIKVIYNASYSEFKYKYERRSTDCASGTCTFKEV